MGKDSIREKDVVVAGGSRRSGRPVSASPYSENYRPPIDLCQRHLINHRLMVAKLTRRELEDKYLSLCDENYSIKKRFLEQEEQIKRLKTRLMRLSNESTNRSKSRLDLATSGEYRLHDLELQRRELHEKLEALRRATSNDGRRLENQTKSTSAGSTKHSAGNQRRSKSARPAKDSGTGRRECKSSSPSNDEEGEHRQHRLASVGKARSSTDDRTEDEEDDHCPARNGHRKSYGADDEDEDEDDDDDREEDDRREDEDRDVLSGGSEGSRESVALTGSGGPKRGSKEHNHRTKAKTKQGQHCPDCERYRSEQLTRETDLVKMKLNIKYLHKELQNEKEKSGLLARQLEEKLSYEIMKRNAAENMEILNLNRQVEDLAKELQRQVDEQKRSMEHELRKQGDLEGQIRKEKDKNTSLFEECERLKKNIEKLKENMSEVEIERDFLRRQQENFTKIVDENKLLKYQLDELRKHNEDLLKQIDSLKEEELVTKESQRELLEKLKTLQQDNDTLSVMLEGLRTENELLAEERTQLEHSLKSLEASPIKEVRPMSPKPALVCAVTQTDCTPQEDHGTGVEDGKAVPSETETFVREPSPEVQRPALVKQPEPSSVPVEPTPPPKRSSMVSRGTREQQAEDEATQLLFRQVSVSRMIPKVSQIMNNRIDEPAKPNNIELLLANSYPDRLEQSFRESERFYELQKVALRRRNTDRGSSISSATEKRRISFIDSPNGSSLRESENSVQENYARYFDIQRLPSMWHRIAENPLTTISSTPTPTFAPQRQDDEVLTIEIRSVSWHAMATERLRAAKVMLYYVEFTFLDLHGHRLETPQSDRLFSDSGDIQLSHSFNFRVNVELDTKLHSERRTRLKEMLQPDGNDAIRFVVVNEDRNMHAADRGGQSSEDIGYASVRLRTELESASTREVSSLVVNAPIFDFFRDHDEIGALEVEFGNTKLLWSLMETAGQGS